MKTNWQRIIWPILFQKTASKSNLKISSNTFLGSKDDNFVFPSLKYLVEFFRN